MTTNGLLSQKKKWDALANEKRLAALVRKGKSEDWTNCWRSLS